MFVHRWMTLSHIISTTKLDWCNKKAVDETGDGTLDKEAIEFVSALQRDNTTLQPTSISPGGAATGNDLPDKDHPFLKPISVFNMSCVHLKNPDFFPDFFLGFFM